MADGNQIVPSSAWAMYRRAATGDLQVSRPWRRRWLLFRDASMPRRPTAAANAMRQSSSKRESPGRVTDQLASLDNPGRVLDVTWVVGKLGIIVCPLCCWFLELIHACVLHLHSGYADNGPGSWLWSTCTCLWPGNPTHQAALRCRGPVRSMLDASVRPRRRISSRTSSSSSHHQPPVHTISHLGLPLQTPSALHGPI